MADQLSLEEVIFKSYTRALPARRFIKVIQDFASRRDIPPHSLSQEITHILLSRLISMESPPALLLGYLAQLIRSEIVTPLDLLTHLLFFISDSKTPSTALSVSISTIILSSLPDTFTLPSVLDRPAVLQNVPDIGTSASASPPPSSSSTLGLLLPLLRQCSTGSTPPSINLLLNRLLVSLQPYPAPPLDVGLEAGSLFQSLPETLSVPLRDCLSGLMADLAVSQDPTTLPPTAPVPTVPTSEPVQPGAVAGIVAGQNVPIQIPPLPLFQSQLPTLQALSFELSLLSRSNGWTTMDPSNPDIPPENHIALIRLGRSLCPDPQTFLSSLVEAALRASGNSRLEERVDRWLFVTERLPILLKWWKEHPQQEWVYPDTLRNALANALVKEKEGLAACDLWISNTLKSLTEQAEHDDAGDFSQPEGWMMCSQPVTLIQRLVDLGLLQRSDASALLPGMSFPSNSPGEPLITRIANAPRSHLRALSHIIAYAPGAARSMAKDAFEAVRDSPQAVPLDGLFVNLAQEPNFLAAMGGIITSATWSGLIQSQLVEYPDDPSARNEDPQGSSQRFGEGIVLAEAFFSHFKLPLPALLRDARRCYEFVDLDEPRKACVNGWVKALYGSQGIDDEIILSTSPADFYRLTSSIISQTVAAFARGVLDTETLHSGLSYFAQPLLSWSLAGSVSWLADEIIRNGLISGPHLVVLQEIVLSSSFPDSILRVVGRRVADILEPTTGLMAVLQTSNFDAEAMKQKLSSLSIAPNTTTSPLADLQLELQNLKSIELAPAAWSSTLIQALGKAVQWHGPTETSRMVYDEILTAPTIALSVDSFVSLTSWLSVRKANHSSPLYTQIAPVILPNLLDPMSAGTTLSSADIPAITALARSLKYTLVSLSMVDQNAADSLAEDIVEELTYRRGLASQSSGTAGSTDTNGDGVAIENDLRGVVQAIVTALGGDEELRGRWTKFENLLE